MRLGEAARSLAEDPSRADMEDSHPNGLVSNIEDDFLFRQGFELLAFASATDTQIEEDLLALKAQELMDAADLALEESDGGRAICDTNSAQLGPVDGPELEAA